MLNTCSDMDMPLLRMGQVSHVSKWRTIQRMPNMKALICRLFFGIWIVLVELFWRAVYHYLYCCLCCRTPTIWICFLLDFIWGVFYIVRLFWKLLNDCWLMVKRRVTSYFLCSYLYFVLLYTQGLLMIGMETEWVYACIFVLFLYFALLLCYFQLCMIFSVLCACFGLVFVYWLVFEPATFVFER